jgi:hypothetical protein
MSTLGPLARPVGRCPGPPWLIGSPGRFRWPARDLGKGAENRWRFQPPGIGRVPARQVVSGESGAIEGGRGGLGVSPWSQRYLSLPISLHRVC